MSSWNPNTPSATASTTSIAIYLTQHPQRHEAVVRWKHFPHYWPFVGVMHRSLVISPHKVQWRGDLMFSLICARINVWVNIREARDLRSHRTHCDDIVMVHLVDMFWLHCTERHIKFIYCVFLLELNVPKITRQLKAVSHEILLHKTMITY